MTGTAPVLRIECSKLFASPVPRTAAIAILAMVTATSAGGYAAAIHAPDSEMGRKAAAMIIEPGWSGYLGLTALSLGTTLLLAGGIVTAWTVGLEFAEGTIVGLFAIAASRASIARAKIIACCAWGAVVIGLQSTVSILGGMALGLAPAGAFNGWCTLAISGSVLLCSVLPIAWVATRWRGYLAGISATLAVLVVTNLASGFGAGPYIPWAIPILWATPDANVPNAALVVPVAVGLLGAWATTSSWSHLQLGRS